MTRKTKIIATVGPSIHSKEAINEIIDAGANVLRLNFSHGSNDEYKQIVDWARSSNKKIAIMQDIQGPKIRTGHLENSLDLTQGAEIEIFNKDSKKNNENIVINYDVPKCIHSYLHRIGRSGRWGRKGNAINFITKYDIKNIKTIEQYYQTEIKELPLDFVNS